MAPAPPPEAGPVLSVTAGPKAGSEFPLQGEEVVVGRANDATLSIPDTSVSRRHAVFRPAGSGWVVADLGSGNGTIVNGEPISDERALSSGDVITLGDTEITFRDDAANATVARPAPSDDATNPRAANPPPPPVRRSGAGRPDVRARLSRSGAPAPDAAAAKRKKKLVVLGVLGVVMVLGLAVAVKIKNSQAQAQHTKQLEEMMARKAEIQAVFQEGKNLAARGQWVEAKAKFEEVAGPAEEFPDVAQPLTTYLDRANKEIPSQEALVEAEKRLAENALGDTAAAIAKVAEDSSTATYDKKRELKAKLQKAIDARLGEARLQLANNTKESLPLAIQITDDILKADANHRDAKVVNDTAKEALERLNAPVVVHQGPGVKPWEPAVSRYRDGDATAALSILDECAAKKSLGKDANRCRVIAGDIREAMGLFKKMEDLDGKGLDRLLRLDRAITGGGLSKMGRQAGTQAGTKFCKMASSAKQSGQWGKAAEWANKASEADPESPCAKALMSDLKGRCKDTYMRAYSLKDTQPDDAVPIFRDAVQLCGADEETRSKAQKWIDTIEKGR